MASLSPFYVKDPAMRCPDHFLDTGWMCVRAVSPLSCVNHLGVSKNRGGCKTPQIIHSNKVFHDFHHPFWDTPIFGNTNLLIRLETPNSFKKKCSLWPKKSGGCLSIQFLCRWLPGCAHFTWWKSPLQPSLVPSLKKRQGGTMISSIFCRKVAANFLKKSPQDYKPDDSQIASNLEAWHAKNCRKTTSKPGRENPMFPKYGCWTKNRGSFPPKMDGENNGSKTLILMDDLGIPLFLETPIYCAIESIMWVYR